MAVSSTAATTRSAWLQAEGCGIGRNAHGTGQTNVECGLMGGMQSFRGGGHSSWPSCSFLGASGAVRKLNAFGGKPLGRYAAHSSLRGRSWKPLAVRSELASSDTPPPKLDQNPESGVKAAPPEADENPDCETPAPSAGRRAFLASGAVLLTAAAWQTSARSDTPTPAPRRLTTRAERKKMKAEAEAAAAKAPPRPESRVYDSSVLGEPTSLTSKEGVWKKLAGSRVVYLGTTERVPVAEDQELILEITSKLRNLCFKERRPVTIALQVFPRTLQEPLNWYMGYRLTDAQLRAYVYYWPEEMFLRYLPLLKYCRDNGVRLYACGVPSQILRTVLIDGVEGLSPEDRKMYAPPKKGGGLLALNTSAIQVAGDMPGPPSASITLERTYFRFAQARSVVDYSMALAIAEGINAQGNMGVMIAVMGASHTAYGSRGQGVPARLAGKLKRQGQTVVMLNPEAQYNRKEGDVPVADFLWYSGTKVCTRNCFDRAEVARVMDAAGRVREALPTDIQAGLDQGLIPPDVLKDFFELQSSPLMAFFTERFQGLRERWLADPRFLQRLGIEEAISISTTLAAQYQKRGAKFWSELEYVITDVSRGAVVDFFTVWLPAPTLSFTPVDEFGASGFPTLFSGLPENAFQRGSLGRHWGLRERALAVLLGGAKLFLVGAVSSVGTVAITNGVKGLQERLRPQVEKPDAVKRSPVFKTAFVYASFLATSANLRYQAIAGIVENWVADYYLAPWPLAGAALSFTARTVNSFWGTAQWIDLARWAGLQAHKDEIVKPPEMGIPKPPLPGLPLTTTGEDNFPVTGGHSTADSAEHPPPHEVEASTSHKIETNKEVTVGNGAHDHVSGGNGHGESHQNGSGGANVTDKVGGQIEDVVDDPDLTLVAARGKESASQTGKE